MQLDYSTWVYHYCIISPLSIINTKHSMALDSKVPKGPIKDKWTTYKDKIDLSKPC